MTKEGNKNELENLVSIISGLQQHAFDKLLLDIEENSNSMEYRMLLTSAPRIIPKLLLWLKTGNAKNSKEWIENIAAFTSISTIEDSALLGNTMHELQEEDTRNLVKYIADNEDNCGLLHMMAKNKTTFPQKFMTAFAKSFLAKEKVSPRIVSDFGKTNTIPLESFLPLLDGSIYAEANKEKLDLILADQFYNFTTDEIYIKYLKERNIFEKACPEEQSLIVKWINAGSPAWITYSVTNPRFGNTILDELMKDPEESNKSLLMKIIDGGDSLGNNC